MNKKQARIRRARQTRIRIALQGATRLVVSRSNAHIYAQIVAPDGGRVLASASTLEGEVRKDLPNGGNTAAAAVVGKRIAERAKALGDHLIVGVTTQQYDDSRGKLNVRQSLMERIANVQDSGLADEVIFSDPAGAITIMHCEDAASARPTTTPHGLRDLAAG